MRQGEEAASTSHQQDENAGLEAGTVIGIECRKA